MFKQMFEAPGHVPSMIAAAGAGVATGSAAVAGLTYIAGRALGAAISAPSEKEPPNAGGRHSATSDTQFKDYGEK